MKISSKSFRLVALASSVVATGAAFAAFNMDLHQTTSQTVSYASELKYLPNALGIQIGSFTVKLGNALSGTSSANTRFIRVDLTNAVLGAAVSGVASPSVAASLPENGSFLSSITYYAGGSGDSFAIWQVNASASGNTADQLITVSLPNLVVADNTKGDVSVKYRTYSTATEAIDGVATPLTVKSGAVANFKTGLAVTGAASATAAALATVSSGYKSFGTSAASVSNTGILGTLLIGTNSGVKARNGASDVGLADLLDTATSGKLVLTGDFSAAGAGGVFLGTASCGAFSPALTGVFAASSAADPAGRFTSTITLPNNLASAPYGSAVNVCYTANGTTAIPKSAAISGAVTLVASANASPATSATVTLSPVSRDGTSLQAPFFQVTPGWIARIILTNTGSSDASYTGTVYAGPVNDPTKATNTVLTNGTLTGVIPKNGGQVIIENTALAPLTLPTFGTSNRGFIVFDVGGVNSVINGVYQLVNGTTGSITNTNMVRPSNAYGSGSTAVQ